MNWTRIILISASLLLVAYFTFQLDLWAGDFKNLFYYLGDWKSWFALAALLYAIKGIVQWLLLAEVRVTEPKEHRK